MYSFFPQVLIIVSIVGIIVIVLRKVPQVAGFATREELRALPQKLWLELKKLAKKLGQYVLEVKELSARQNFLEKFRRARLQIPRPSLRFFRSPDSPEFYLQQAQADLEKENYAEAERKFIKVIEKDPKNEAAFAGLGKLYLALKKFEEAAETYKFLLKYYPGNDTYYANLGQAYHGQKLYGQAIEAYEKAIELVPEVAKRYVNLGLTLEAKKHLEEAILNYRKACDLEKTNPQFLMVLAEALSKRGDKEEAEVILEQILLLEPTNHLAREKLMQLKF